MPLLASLAADWPGHLGSGLLETFTQSAEERTAWHLLASTPGIGAAEEYVGVRGFGVFCPPVSWAAHTGPQALPQQQPEVAEQYKFSSGS